MPQPTNVQVQVTPQPTTKWMLQGMNAGMPQPFKYMLCLSQQIHDIPQPTSTCYATANYYYYCKNTCMPLPTNTCYATSNKYVNATAKITTCIQQATNTCYATPTKTANLQYGVGLKDAQMSDMAMRFQASSLG